MIQNPLQATRVFLIQQILNTIIAQFCGIVELYWLKSVVPEGCKEPEEEQDEDGLTPENQINVKTVQ